MEVANSGAPEPRPYMRVAFDLVRSPPTAIGNCFDMFLEIFVGYVVLTLILVPWEIVLRQGFPGCLALPCIHAGLSVEFRISVSLCAVCTYSIGMYVKVQSRRITTT